MHHHTAILRFILLIAVSHLLLSVEVYGDRASEWLEMVRGDETMVRYYGLLLDQNDNPVQGAKVEYEIHRAALYVPIVTKGSVRTGKDGRFSIHGLPASLMDILDIKLKGYEYHENMQSIEARRVDFRRSRTALHHPDKDNPVVFRIRRRNPEAVFIWESQFGLELLERKPDKWSAYDFAVRGRISWNERESKEVFPDVRMTGEYDEATKTWKVILRPGGENAGIQLLGEKLYEAPADGYITELPLVLKEGDEPKLKGRFLYVRIRDCGMYARIELAGAAIDGNRLYMRGNAFVNPYGDRCLEAIEFTDIGYEDYKKCKRDAEKAMEQQRLAPRPPFEQLIKEGKAKY